LRSEMSASIAAKSSACTKPMIIRCASLSDRAPARTSSQRDRWAPSRADFRVSSPGQNRPKC
jgi:hypothetical protein